MLYIGSDGSVRLTRGDTARISVTVTNEVTGEPYVISDTDTVTMTIKKNYKDTEHFVQKILHGSSMFKLEHSDTENLPFGKYIFDIQLETSDGDVYTVIEPTTFELTKEVTY